MLTYTGRWISSKSGEPSLIDIAMQLGSIARFCGATRIFWPVLLHSMVVADLLPLPIQIYGLLHDSTELYFSDIPGPEKPKCIRLAEARILRRILKSMNIPQLSASQWKQVKIADERALHAEAYVLGNDALKAYFPRDRAAEFVVEGYANRYEPLAISAVSDFVTRVKALRHLPERYSDSR